MSRSRLIRNRGLTLLVLPPPPVPVGLTTRHLLLPFAGRRRNQQTAALHTNTIKIQPTLIPAALPALSAPPPAAALPPSAFAARGVWEGEAPCERVAVGEGEVTVPPPPPSPPLSLLLPVAPPSPDANAELLGVGDALALALLGDALALLVLAPVLTVGVADTAVEDAEGEPVLDGVEVVVTELDGVGVAVEVPLQLLEPLGVGALLPVLEGEAP